MRANPILVTFLIVVFVASCSAPPVDDAGDDAGDDARVAVDDPLPAPVENQGLEVLVVDVARLPETRNLRPPDEDVNPSGWARVSFVRDAPDGRRFVNDSRGFLYVLGENGPELYASFDELPLTVYNRLESGFIGFDFHPEFAENGLFYTVHSERGPGNPEPVDFIPPGFTEDDVTYHNVITEWRNDDPAADTFSGTRRTLLRVAHVVDTLTHPFGFVGFNPTAAPGDPDYGLLYTSGSDTGFSNGAGPNGQDPGQLQRLDTLIGAILRIDPRSPSESGGIAGIGDYTIPPSNPYAGDDDPDTLGEIYASGFRNAHRLSWDLDDGTMFANDIGMSQIEEVNIVRSGGNYGWMQREGYFDNGINVEGSSLNEVFPLPEDILNGETPDPFIYPVAIYDHDEGRAISGGFTYHGPIAALAGKYIFGDINNGRVFAADVAAMKAADDGVPRTVAPVEEVALYVRDADGERRDVTFSDLVEEAFGETSRTDLHLGRGRNGEIFLTSRQDGMIRELVPDPAMAESPGAESQ